jgi:xanthine dehydrogenase accessory factor
VKRALLDALMVARAANRPTVLATRLEDGAQALIVNGTRGHGDLDVDAALLDACAAALRRDKSGVIDGVFLNVFNPPLRLIIIGAVHIAQVLAPMATLAGYAVTVIDPRGAWANETRFPDVDVIQDWPEEAMETLAPDARTAIAALTHDPKLDDPALAVALASEAFYVGALGSKKTAAARAGRLAESGVPDSAIARIDGPIGLDIGAVSPAEIAVAILGKMTLSLRGAKADRRPS